MTTEIINIVLQVVVILAAGAVGYLYRNIHETGVRIGKTETDILHSRKMLDEKVGNLGERLDDKIDRLRMRGDKLGDEFTSSDQSTGKKFGDLSCQISRIDQSLTNVMEALRKNEKDLAAQEGRAKELYEKIYRVNSDLNNTHLDLMKISNQVDGMK